ncbi:capsular exopolysaccharide synthesis family protein [Paenibacillus mucilaginosus]|uniref:CpsD/CapB family tyrosine-protein kinase n=1 Tax=Paenibacillus mucilaginosus TaxID=61624 RepID=UPI003D224F96
MPQRSSKDNVIITEANPQSPISESYRTLRTNIDFSLVDNDNKVIMVTSTQQAEGKTTTAVNMAVAYAQAEKKVLIVDADMRRPNVHNMFRRPNRVGLSNLLAGQYTVQELVTETHIPHLEMLSAGVIPHNPSELLSSERWVQFIEFAKNKYDVVIIDTPPALSLPDAQLVAGHSCGVVIVIDVGKVKREAVKKMKSNLEHAKGRILGVVLNNMNKKEAGTYAYQY